MRMGENARNRKPATGNDVAELAGVSKSAVSRAFTGGSVSPDARERIVRAAKQLRYRPNQAARSLKTSRSRLIGLAVSHIDNLFYPAVIQALSEEFATHGYRIALFVTHGDRGLDPVLDELLGFSLDGVILASSSLASEVASQCIDASIPALMFNNVDVDAMVPGISADNRAGGAAIGRHFVDQGYRRTAVISGVAESSTSSERTGAFVEAIKDCGLPEPLMRSGEYTYEGAAAAMKSLLGLDTIPDAVFCVNDHMATAAIETCHAAGLRPGRDIAIAGFDNTAIAGWPTFNLTSYSQPLEEMVTVAVEHMLAAIEGRQVENMVRRIPGRLVIRQSTGRA